MNRRLWAIRAVLTALGLLVIGLVMAAVLATSTIHLYF